MEIRVWRGDITTLAVDAIVNAANDGLRRGGGVCGAIFAAAGPRLDEACDAIGHCATGDAVVTAGFDLPARFVVHAVGPVWHGGTHGEPDLLASCYRRSVEVAAAAGARSIAFPAISTGIYGYPPDAAAQVAVSTLRSLIDASGTAALDEVVLVAFDTATEARYRSLLTAR
jgi:O-acetyl-ADP-ribose deacetylase